MKRPKLRERLLSKAVVNWETGCWEWTAVRNQGGYGRFYVAGKKQVAHRVAYELIEGPIPEGLVLDHLCRNRVCINPAELDDADALDAIDAALCDVHCDMLRCSARIAAAGLDGPRWRRCEQRAARLAEVSS